MPLKVSVFVMRRLLYLSCEVGDNFLFKKCSENNLQNPRQRIGLVNQFQRKKVKHHKISWITETKQETSGMKLSLKEHSLLMGSGDEKERNQMSKKHTHNQFVT